MSWLLLIVWAYCEGFFLALFGSAERSCLNVETNLPYGVVGKSQLTEKLNWRKICISHFVLLSAENSFQVFIETTNRSQPLWKIVVPQKHVLEQNSQLLTPPPLKFGFLVLWVSMEMENWCQPIWKIGKMADIPQKCILEQNSQLLTTLKFGSTVFWVLTGMENWCQSFWKFCKNNLNHRKHILEQNSKLLIPLKFRFRLFWVSAVMENMCQPLWKIRNIRECKNYTC